MISILIPVYNYSVVRLVSDLHAQAIALPCPFEIIVADDCSDAEYIEQNAAIEKLLNVRYIQVSENMGRARIRNFLAHEAQFQYLIFMDCDAEVRSDTFLQTYYTYCTNTVVVCGGTAYDFQKPEKNKMLRWRYGLQREQISAHQRNIRPNASFSTFNFLISKSVIIQIPFNESIREYGHEDTLFGFELYKHGYKILHIDNQLIHKGLDENTVFVEKTKRAIEGLFTLLHNPAIDQAFFSDITLARFYSKVIQYRLRSPIKLLFILMHLFFKTWLIRGTAPLRIYDFYKLGYMCTLS
ncbi:MAG TPA: glycosyltransferase family 2 protein [Bacteroidales bacterium]|nr:glycosyltransferase family 2 protein [Bacteroidales bacterium]